MISKEDFEVLCEKLGSSLKNYAKFSIQTVNPDRQEDEEEQVQIEIVPKDMAMRRVVLDALISYINMQDKFDLRIQSNTRNFLIISGDLA